jgi:hypothetical protein
MSVLWHILGRSAQSGFNVLTSVKGPHSPDIEECQRQVLRRPVFALLRLISDRKCHVRSRGKITVYSSKLWLKAMQILFHSVDKQYIIKNLPW